MRPPIYFDPLTGKLAYPFLRPHLAKRPPFAPNHGPAPFLDPIRHGTDPPKPGENGPWSLCPDGTQTQEFVIHSINLPITLSRSSNIVDPVGQLYVLKEEEDAVRADNGLRSPLAIRANAGEDCVDIVFKSELEDSGENDFFSKANIHVHFVQFDVQAATALLPGLTTKPRCVLSPRKERRFEEPPKPARAASSWSAPTDSSPERWSVWGWIRPNPLRSAAFGRLTAPP